MVVPEFGSDPPPTPPPAWLDPLVPLLCVPLLPPPPPVAPVEVACPVPEAMTLPDVLLVIILPLEVGEDIIMVMLEPIMDEVIIVLEPVIIELESIAPGTIEEPVVMADAPAIEPDAIAPDAVVEAVLGTVVSRLATPLGPALPIAAPPIPPCLFPIYYKTISQICQPCCVEEAYICNSGGRSPISVKESGEKR